MSQFIVVMVLLHVLATMAFLPRARSVPAAVVPGIRPVTNKPGARPVTGRRLEPTRVATRSPTDISAERDRDWRLANFRRNLRNFDSGTGLVLISPSVAKADVMNLERDLTEVVEAGAYALHLGPQDGHFVPKVSFISPDVVKAIRKKFPSTFLDVKLSIALNGADAERRTIKEYANAGADLISIHPESVPHQLSAVIDMIQAHGVATGVVLNPGTPFATIEPLLRGEMLDVVVIMLVNPGHGGSKYQNLALEKIDMIKTFCKDNGKMMPYIEIDGGISSENAASFIDAGANMLVAGGSIFKASDKFAAIQEIVGHNY